VLIRSLIAAMALSVLAAAPAHAAPAWLPPFTLNPEGLDASNMAVAVGADGTTVAAWNRRDEQGNRVLEAVRRSPGGAFGPRTVLSSSFGNDPQVGMDAAGNATVTWGELVPGGPGTRVRAARLAAGAASFEPAQTLSAGSDARAPAIGVGANGTAVVIFTEGAPPNAVVKAAIRDGAGGLFGNAQTISDPALFFYATSHTATGDVVVGPDGGAVAVFAGHDGNRFVVETNERAPNSAFSPTATTQSPTSANASGEHPAAVIDPSGRVTVAWSQVDDVTSGSSPKEIRFITRPPGAGFGSFDVASEPGVVAESPDLAVAANGTVIGAWVTGTGSARSVEAAFHAPGAAGFSGHDALSPGQAGSTEPMVAANAAGDAIVLWPDFDTSAVVAARRVAGGAFDAGFEVVNDWGEPAGTQFVFDQGVLALDDEGNATALWRFDHFRSGTHFFRVQGAGFDAAPPALSASVPPAGVAGAPVGMAAATLDRWGPVSVHWAFGDGATAAGDAVSHAFGSAGPFAVTVTATDAVGNATSATRPISVAAPPPGRIDSSVSTRWGFDRAKRFIFLLRMRVKAPPKGAVAELRCSGRKCKFNRKRVTRIRRNRIDVFKALRKSQRRFRPRQVLQLRITAPGMIGKVVKFRLKRGRIPNGQTLCLPPGAKKPRRVC
jgi:hypothetical protein